MNVNDREKGEVCYRPCERHMGLEQQDREWHTKRGLPESHAGKFRSHWFWMTQLDEGRGRRIG